MSFNSQHFYMNRQVAAANVLLLLKGLTLFSSERLGHKGDICGTLAIKIDLLLHEAFDLMCVRARGIINA
jgi:hypothetical protein